MFASISSFIFVIILLITSCLDLPLRGYESKELINDTEFSNGFIILSQETVNNISQPLGKFNCQNSNTSPSWMIAQWNSGPCLWENRISCDENTITDGSTKFVTYNPDDKSVSMRLNAANIYNGESADSSSWPHLLLEQSPIVDYHLLSDEDKQFYNCSADRMVLSLDIRLKDFVDTTNTNGVNAVQYLAYFYLADTDGHNFIWFGVNLFDSRGYQNTYWAPDSVGGLMIYSISTKDTYKFSSNSLYRNDKPYVSDEWTHISIDLAVYIASVIDKANESNTFGEAVSIEDFYISGTNIGFEIHGNYDCTVDIKNLSLCSYIKT